MKNKFLIFLIFLTLLGCGKKSPPEHESYKIEKKNIVKYES